MPSEKFFIAQIGRTVGLWGDLKFHLHTDFPEQFQKGITFQSSYGDLTIADINMKRELVRFQGFENIDTAKKLTNVKLYADKTQTKASCILEKGQHFWFDMIGCDVVENDEVLGKIDEIQRLADIDYLSIETNEKLVNEGMPNRFLLPYINRYIIDANTDVRVVWVKDGKDVLEAS
ncbi:MAG: ribosome maturation factor RimM [Sulfurovum sp.]|nr:ribosome maturation factor RimM [Sulfurovum sp.]MCB4745022.1 ribosome maturation factor RimM [Sulfurovum sp.]MCB4746532.1 ribosome maturation factor RimM [Sulfurovum sp.]MCB4747244.1 ribosome maturation factor RimM [Sulfurovum sp.]MCB4748809.1 ribosome maturation factor RimM [Sulfurovum sp.]